MSGKHGQSPVPDRYKELLGCFDKTDGKLPQDVIDAIPARLRERQMAAICEYSGAGKE